MMRNKTIVVCDSRSSGCTYSRIVDELIKSAIASAKAMDDLSETFKVIESEKKQTKGHERPYKYHK